MCGRFALKKAHLAQIAEMAGIMAAESALPASRFNIAPGGRIPVIRAATRGDARELADLGWGLSPAWAAPGARPLTNARVETAAVKPAFRDSFRRRRCLMPATAFYEWESTGGARRPWAFLRADGEPFCLGGIWDGETCAVLTTAADAVMAPVHHRMPVLVAADDWSAWLDHRIDVSDTYGGATAAPFRPARGAPLLARPVSTRVNTTANDDEECLAGATANGLFPGTGGQLDLGW